MDSEEGKSLPSSVEASIFGVAEETMEYVTHLVEEGHDIVMSH
jgi:hypothetical protein